MGGQEGPKRHQKRHQNGIKILIDFLIDFGPNLEAQEIKDELGCGMRGAWLSSLNSRIRIRQFRNPFRHAPTLRVAADLIAHAQSAGPVSNDKGQGKWAGRRPEKRREDQRREEQS